jgi:acyl-coenzyme A thioesterase PaaI-like protein
MRQEIQNPFVGNNCFFCGTDNHHGLKLKFYWDEERQETSTEYVPAQQYAGLGNILHGAMQTGLLDEIMGWSTFVHTHAMAVTSDLTIKFLSPVYIRGNPVTVTCRLLSKDGPKVHMQAMLTNSEGVVCTTATGTFHIVSAKRYQALVQGQ